ncbi:unnamed protein product [Hyaloperonospora brassicae]|uniref:Uncharacterized protein n=1 Tax=Hyaloperonospora brassicae TaxID=162125 RepID=A0AAV0TM32_HYABA|nr:unnamed protein product [Hyaloperonospora brassicae]
MQSRLLVAIAALVAALATPLVDARSAVVAASTSQCSAVSTCHEGGVSSTSCSVASGGCPPCITFSDQGCYVKINGACPFGVDCASAWEESAGETPPSSDSDKTPSTDANADSDAPDTETTAPADEEAEDTADAVASANANNANNANPTGPSTATTVDPAPETTPDANGVAGNSSAPTEPPSSASGSSGTSAETLSNSGSDMSVVFAIIGAAIGVIAVAVIFLTLVRRSNAAHDEDEDDMSSTMRVFAKGAAVQGPQSTMGSAAYSSYNGSNRPQGMDAGNGVEVGLDTSRGPSMNAVSYYNQQPLHSSAAPSPRVAGRAIPSQPVGLTPGNGLTRSYGGGQNFGTASGFGASAVASPGVNGGNPVPSAPVQHLNPAGGVAPPPHIRRDSVEF